MDRILLSLKSEQKSCFHWEHFVVEIRESNGRYFARAARDDARGDPLGSAPQREISGERFQELQEAVNRVLAKKEQNESGNSTSGYHAKLERLVDEKLVALDTSSSALPRETLIQLAESPNMRSDLLRKVRLALAVQHIWAHELHSIAEACVKEWGNGPV